MKIVTFLPIIAIFLLPDELKFMGTLILSGVWVLYTIYFSININRIRDKKVNTNNISMNPPNNNNSAYIRFLYSGKVDYKVFITTIVELILKDSISLFRKNQCEYFFIDNKIPDEVLTNSEARVKKLLFSNIGANGQTSLKEIETVSKKSSGYVYSIYCDWINTFSYECAQNKYFKAVKPIVDNSLIFFMASFIIAILNVIYTEYIWLSLIIFTVTSLLIKLVNDYANREDDAKVEYKKWLEFKNYIKSMDSELLHLDTKTLENYATYAYVLDEYDSFVRILNKIYDVDNDVFNDSTILTIMNFRIFDEIEARLKKSINKSKIKSTVFLSKNKGRRV